MVMEMDSFTCILLLTLHSLSHHSAILWSQLTDCERYFLIKGAL